MNFKYAQVISPSTFSKLPTLRGDLFFIRLIGLERFSATTNNIWLCFRIVQIKTLVCKRWLIIFCADVKACHSRVQVHTLRVTITLPSPSGLNKRSRLHTSVDHCPIFRANWFVWLKFDDHLASLQIDSYVLKRKNSFTYKFPSLVAYVRLLNKQNAAARHLLFSELLKGMHVNSPSITTPLRSIKLTCSSDWYLTFSSF